MSARRDYGAYQKARDIIIAQVAANAWPSATTDFLVRRAVDLARIPDDIAYGRSKYYGQGNHYLMNELMRDKLRKIENDVFLEPCPEFPDGKMIHPRAVYNIPTGRPLNRKRAENPEAFAKMGLWVHIRRFQASEANLQIMRYRQRRSDSAETIATVEATDAVLRQCPPLTYANDVWDDIRAAIPAFLRPAI